MPTFDLRDSMSSTISSDQQISLRQNVTSPLWRQTLFGSREYVWLFLWNLLGKENAERKENEHKRHWWLTTIDVYNSDSIKTVNKCVSLRSLQMWGSQDRSLPFSIPTFVCFVTSHIVHKSQDGDDNSMFWDLQRESLRLLLQRGGHSASWEQRILYARRVGTGVGGRVTGVLSLVPVLWRIFISQIHLILAINWSNSYRK